MLRTGILSHHRSLELSTLPHWDLPNDRLSSRLPPGPGQHRSTLRLHGYAHLRYQRYVESYNICPFVTGTFHLSVMSLRLLPAAALGRISSFFSGSTVFRCVYIEHIFSIQSSVRELSGHLPCWPLWRILQWTSVCKDLLEVCLQFLQAYSWSGTAGLHGSSVFHFFFLRNFEKEQITKPQGTGRNMGAPQSQPWVRHSNSLRGRGLAKQSTTGMGLSIHSWSTWCGSHTRAQLF